MIALQSMIAQIACPNPTSGSVLPLGIALATGATIIGMWMSPSDLHVVVSPVTPTRENYHCRLLREADNVLLEADNVLRHYVSRLYLRR